GTSARRRPRETDPGWRSFRSLARLRLDSAWRGPSGRMPARCSRASRESCSSRREPERTTHDEVRIMAGTRLDTTDHAHFDSRSPLPREPGRLLDTTPQGRDRALDRGTTGARRPARKKSPWGRRARWALRGALLGAVLLACVKLPRTARADHELWLWSEMRIPVATAEEFPVRTTFRLFNDTRFSGRRDGLHQVFLRFGPMFEVTPWLLLALNATVYADHLASGAFDEERRAELEPTVHWRWGDLAFTDRNRLEY